MRLDDFQEKQAGFGLVEIMVALVIGLLTTLVIMQVFTAFEGQKRTTMGTADAQTNGSVALYSIARDVQMAGFGLLPVTDSPLNCDPQPTIEIDDDNDAATPLVEQSLDLAPVVITDETSDSISVVYGNNPMGGAPSLITAVVGNTLTVNNSFGCRIGDIALIANGSSCAAAKVTGPAGIAALAPADPEHKTHVVLDSATSVTAAGLGADAMLACLGAWTRIDYRVNNGNLEVRTNGVDWEPRISGIVNIQAQYGISDAPNNNTISAWVNPSPDWTAPTVAERNRIKAVRIAVIARNGLYEKDVVSTECSSIEAPSPTGVCAWTGTEDNKAPTVDLSADADWEHYRYRVFDSIIPIRNTIWSKDTL